MKQEVTSIKQTVTPKDTFKTIKDFPNYEVSNTGLVRNKKRQRILKPSPNGFGYYQVGLYREGKQKFLRVNRLVALAFIPNPLGKPYVNHINGRTTDNNVSNLEWCTQKENVRHAYDTGLIPTKYTEEQIHEVCRLLQDKLMIKEVSSKTGVSISTVKMVRARKTWTHISQDYTWESYKR